VLSILMGLAVPAFRSFLQNDQQWTQTSNLVVGLNIARSEAIKDDVNGVAKICSSNDGTSCTDTAWEGGWIVLGADPASPNSPPKLLQVVGALPAGTKLTESSNNTRIPFMSNGALGPLAIPESVVAFKMCDSRGAASARYLQVSAMGRVSASQTPGKDLTGAALACP
jgi:type IV fimbrial biogenesis protein FimT